MCCFEAHGAGFLLRSNPGGAAVTGRTEGIAAGDFGLAVGEGDCRGRVTAEFTELAALSGFKRFPTWRNADVLDLVAWLREHNARRPVGKPKAGFYGLDLYSLYESIDAVLRYLLEIDPDAARHARYRYSCFDHFGEDVPFAAITPGSTHFRK